MGSTRFVRAHGDLLLAVVLSVAFQIEVWLGLGSSGDETITSTGPTGQLGIAAVGLALTVSLAWRSRWPLLSLGLAFVALAAIGPGGIDGAPALVIAMMAATWSVGAGTHDTAAIAGAVGVVGLIAAAISRDPDATAGLGDLLVPIVLLGGPWAVGLAARIRRDQVEGLRARAEALEQERDASARAAVLAERARIARELHDVVAHAISIMVVQARGARHRLAEDPDEAREAILAIETTGVDALTEMRRLLGILGHTDASAVEAEFAPRPGLADIDRLVGQMREAGLPVEVSVEGEPSRLPAGVDLSAYRIVQEALTNALRHAGTATARVVIRYSDPAVDLEIADDGHGDAAGGELGHGLIGMRERAALVGGIVEAGPAVGGGYVVRAHLPVASA